MDSLKGSYELVKNNVGSVLLVVLLALTLGIVGFLTVLGFVISTPFALIVMTLSFRDLTPQDAE